MRKRFESRKLRVESLEERTLLAVTAGSFEHASALPKPAGATNWIVNTLNDATSWDAADDILSLREAISRAQTGDTITFDDSLAGDTITLCGSGLNVDRGITIDATSVGGMTIDADRQSRVFYISGGNETNPVELICLTITGGNAVNDGGGIYNSGTLTLTDSVISKNTAKGGGGIYNHGALTTTNSTLSGNSANGYKGGGGIYNNGTLTITNSTLSENSANGYKGGGGIFNSGTLTLTDSTVFGNIANGDDGGGIYNGEGSTLTLTNSTVSGNIARGAYVVGGGIYNNGTLTITNSTLSGNSAISYGGGIFNSGTLTLTDSTISGNTARGDGGGICNYYDGTLDLYNSIIAQNTAVAPGNDIYKYRNVGTLNAYNTLSSFTDWTESENCIVYDISIPLFTDALHGDFTPAKDSQAVNKGNNDYATTETDLAGSPRIYDGTVDIGAYEYQGVPAPTPTEQLASPTITTGNRGIYVSYGANRHQITWTAVENASGYELTYTTDGINWSSAWVGGTSGAVGNLTYGSDVTYRVRALGEGSYINSEWSSTKTFCVCPMDINGDGDISGNDRTLLAFSWLDEEGDDNYRYYADINGDGDIGGADRAYLSNNWLLNVEDDADDLQYSLAKRVDVVCAEFESGDLEADLGLF